jgi:putative phosphoribosyl transferase
VKTPPEPEPVRLPFRDRRAAGCALGQELRRLRLAPAVVLGIPRGGVAVAWAVCRSLGGALGALVAVKVAAPFNPEFALGALVPDEEPVWNEDFLRAFPLGAAEREAALREARAEAARRRRLFGAPPPLSGRDVLVVDDGFATGLTALAALRAVRRQGAGSVTAAAPVAARETLAALGPEADRVVALATPEPFVAVGAFYEDFRQMTDDEVRELLGGADVTG